MLKKFLKLSIIFGLLSIIFLIIINFYVLIFWEKNYFKEIEKLPKSKYGLVFWASVNKDWTPSLVLKDRLDISIKAYKAWKVEKIIVSGFASNDWYNEPEWMKKYLIKSWVWKKDIILDNKWIDTFNSIKEAKKIVWNEKIIFFSQDFQLKRAIYIASKLWVTFYWMETNLRKYKKNNYFREFWARIKAFFEIEIQKNLQI